MASTFTPRFNLEKPANNDYVDTWDRIVNANMDKLDAALATVPVATTDPSAPAAGQMWVRSDLSQLRICTGAATLQVTLAVVS
jgi:hypothetical protein